MSAARLSCRLGALCWRSTAVLIATASTACTGFYTDKGVSSSLKTNSSASIAFLDGGCDADVAFLQTDVQPSSGRNVATGQRAWHNTSHSRVQAAAKLPAGMSVQQGIAGTRSFNRSTREGKRGEESGLLMVMRSHMVRHEHPRAQRKTGKGQLRDATRALLAINSHKVSIQKTKSPTPAPTGKDGTPLPPPSPDGVWPPEEGKARLLLPDASFVPEPMILPYGVSWIILYSLYVSCCLIYECRHQNLFAAYDGSRNPNFVETTQDNVQTDKVTAAERIIRDNAANFDTLLDSLCPEGCNNGLEAVDGRRPLSRFQFCKLVWDAADLSEFGVSPQSRVATVLPAGDHSAAALLALMARYAVAPLSDKLPVEELRSSVELFGVQCMVVCPSIDGQHVEFPGVVRVLLEPDNFTAGLFSLSCLHKDDHQNRSWKERPAPLHGPNEISLLLMTSGTTSKPKIVPITQRRLVLGAATFADAHDIGVDDRALNMMPLFHIGGIITNLLAPLAVGATVVCAPGFQRQQLTNWLLEYRISYYSAVPSMHQEVMRAIHDDHVGPGGLMLRVVTSGAAHLPHSLALQLRDLTGAQLFLTYGMTECMPIACTPREYGFEKVDSVGVVVCGELSVRGDDGSPLPSGQTGEVCVRGPLVMPGYLSGHRTDVFSEDNSREEPWFRTGDLGVVDGAGFLFLVGRSKEVINRGGEIVSPFEIENVAINMRGVDECMAFGAPHVELGETVALAIVRSRNSHDGVTYAALQAFMLEKLEPAKVPDAILFVSSIPKTATGKVARIGFAEKLAMKPLHTHSALQERVFDATFGASGQWELQAAAAAAAGVEVNIVQRVDSLAGAMGAEDKGWEFVKLVLLFFIIACHVDQCCMHFFVETDANIVVKLGTPMMISGFVFVSGVFSGSALSYSSVGRFAINTFGTSILNTLFMALLKGLPLENPETNIFWYLVDLFFWRLTIVPMADIGKRLHLSLPMFLAWIYVCSRLLLNSFLPFYKGVCERYDWDDQPLGLDVQWILRGYCSYASFYAVGVYVGHARWTELLNDQRLLITACIGWIVWHIGILTSSGFRDWVSFHGMACASGDMWEEDWYCKWLERGFGFEALEPHAWNAAMFVGDLRYYFTKFYLTFVWVWPTAAIARPLCKRFPRTGGILTRCGNKTLFGYLLHWDFVIWLGIGWGLPVRMSQTVWGVRTPMLILTSAITTLTFTSRLTERLFFWLMPYESCRALWRRVWAHLQKGQWR